MEQLHNTISEAAKQLHVEPHVLRYWEDELHLSIPRNKMGHRVYTDREMTLLRSIIQLKEDGLSLKEIEAQIVPYSPPESTVVTELNEVDTNEKMRRFKAILGRIVTDAIRENSGDLTSDIASDVSDRVNKELDFLFREKEEQDEKRFRQLDEAIRSHQRARQEVAATQSSGNKAKTRRSFLRNNS